jgi:hypothetical protein
MEPAIGQPHGIAQEGERHDEHVEQKKTQGQKGHKSKARERDNRELC